MTAQPAVLAQGGPGQPRAALARRACGLGLWLGIVRRGASVADVFVGAYSVRFDREVVSI